MTARKADPAPETVKAKPRKRGMSKREFAEAHDYNTKTRLAIRRTLKTLKSDEIIKDADFRIECGANSNGFRLIAEEPEFLTYQFKVDDRYFWALPDTIEEIIKIVAKARRAE